MDSLPFHQLPNCQAAAKEGKVASDLLGISMSVDILGAAWCISQIHKDQEILYHLKSVGLTLKSSMSRRYIRISRIPLEAGLHTTAEVSLAG